MTNYRCFYCGTTGTTAGMIISRHTRNAYCRDEIACLKRKDKMIREESRGVRTDR